MLALAVGDNVDVNIRQNAEKGHQYFSFLSKYRELLSFSHCLWYQQPAGIDL